MASHFTSENPQPQSSWRVWLTCFLSVDRDFKYRDPCLTETGVQQASSLKLPAKPDMILVSPMTRTIQTVKLAFREWLQSTTIQVWPDLREAHDAICNQGVSRADLEAKFPDINFAECPDEWNYPPHSVDDAAARAERVRERLKGLVDSGVYQNIYLVTHRGFIAFLVQGERFDVCGKNNVVYLLLGLKSMLMRPQKFDHSVLLPRTKSKARDSVSIETREPSKTLVRLSLRPPLQRVPPRGRPTRLQLRSESLNTVRL